MATKKPVHETRSGRVKAAIWKNEAKTGAFYSVTFSRSYRDAEGAWKDVHSYGARDLFNLIRCAIDAQSWIYRQRSTDRKAA